MLIYRHSSISLKVNVIYHIETFLDNTLSPVYISVFSSQSNVKINLPSFFVVLELVSSDIYVYANL